MRIISIINHGHEQLIQNLIQSLDNFFIPSDKSIQIVLVDNLGEIKKPIKSKKFKIEIITNLRTKGFGANHNLVFEVFKPDILYMINPDILFFENVYEEKILSQMPNFGICSPKIYSPKMQLTDHVRKPLTILNIIRRKFGIAESGNDLWFCGMMLICNKNTFKKLKGFDTGYYMYVEDCDLSVRLKCLGGDLKLLNEISVIHDERRMSFRSLKHLYWHISSLIRFWIVSK